MRQTLTNEDLTDVPSANQQLPANSFAEYAPERAEDRGARRGERGPSRSLATLVLKVTFFLVGVEPHLPSLLEGSNSLGAAGHFLCGFEGFLSRS